MTTQDTVRSEGTDGGVPQPNHSIRILKMIPLVKLRVVRLEYTGWFINFMKEQNASSNDLSVHYSCKFYSSNSFHPVNIFGTYFVPERPNLPPRGSNLTLITRPRFPLIPYFASGCGYPNSHSFTYLHNK